jgi:hypothetical protein
MASSAAASATSRPVRSAVLAAAEPNSDNANNNDSEDLADADDNDSLAARNQKITNKQMKEHMVNVLKPGVQVQVIEMDENITEFKVAVPIKQLITDHIGNYAHIKAQSGTKARFDIEVNSGDTIKAVPWYNLRVSNDTDDEDEDGDIKMKSDDEVEIVESKKVDKKANVKPDKKAEQNLTPEQKLIAKMKDSDDERIKSLLQLINEQDDRLDEELTDPISFNQDFGPLLIEELKARDLKKDMIKNGLFQKYPQMKPFLGASKMLAIDIDAAAETGTAAEAGTAATSSDSE